MTLTTSEAAKLLAAIRLIDNRQWDQNTATAWAQLIIPEATFEETLEAAKHHLMNSTEYLTPAHINKGITAIRDIHRQRIRDAGPPDYPPGLDRRGEHRYRLAYYAAIRSGAAREQAHTTADDHLGARRGQLTGPPPGWHQQLETTFRRPA